MKVFLYVYLNYLDLTTFKVTSYDQLLKLAEECTVDVTPEEAKAAELQTRLQSKSRLWFSMRTGRITASRFKSAAHTNIA